MTYREYLFKEKVKDSEDAYRNYLSKHHSAWNSMNPQMQDQNVKETYKYRFAIQWDG